MARDRGTRRAWDPSRRGRGPCGPHDVGRMGRYRGWMQRHEFLRQLHRVVAPRNYLEIGVSDGRSLTLSTVPSLGIDPAPKVKQPLHADVRIVKATSDAFFARSDPLRHLRDGKRPMWERIWRRGPVGGTEASPTLDLVFIDGMHQFEYALRDFINVERFAAWTSLIVFDDMLPRDSDEAARDRHTKFWAGDVFKLIEVLRLYRPELVILPVDTEPTGQLLVMGADPRSRVLPTAYDDIVRRWVVPDPQVVPDFIVARRDTVGPESIVGSDVWPDVVRARDEGTDRATGYEAIRARLMSLTPVESAVSA
jgi:hypothetical protein